MPFFLRRVCSSHSFLKRSSSLPPSHVCISKVLHPWSILQILPPTSISSKSTYPILVSHLLRCHGIHHAWFLLDLEQSDVLTWVLIFLCCKLTAVLFLLLLLRLSLTGSPCSGLRPATTLRRRRMRPRNISSIKTFEPNATLWTNKSKHQKQKQLQMAHPSWLLSHFDMQKKSSQYLDRRHPLHHSSSTVSILLQLRLHNAFFASCL